MKQNEFTTRILNEDADTTAPDGSEVRLLATSSRGSMAHFELPADGVSKAVVHRNVEELWFITAGEGEMWRKLGDTEEVIDLYPGVSLSIPAGTHFQFRADPDEPLEAIGVTMPPWPGSDEAHEVEGHWPTD